MSFRGAEEDRFWIDHAQRPVYGPSPLAVLYRVWWTHQHLPPWLQAVALRAAARALGLPAPNPGEPVMCPQGTGAKREGT